MNVMDLPFILNGEACTCDIFVDNTENPCLVFVVLHGAGLVANFGEEITIKTDCESLLPRRDDMPRLTHLRQAILDALLKRPEWMIVQRKYKHENKSR
ncbi:MAG: hypothetical protein JWP88_830 [Flaviaesturariibacter sp.]|nr:hypothetical protein [Flaviaesturariibacter sp.]